MKNLFLALEAALRGGDEILKIYNDPASDFAVERKADNSPLTIADRKAHEVIIKTLTPSGIYALSEEGKHESYESRKVHGKLWIIDPLDGTKEFIKRNGEFTVNIALVEAGVPVMGVVYLPVKRILYFASETVGAYRLDDVTCDNAPTSVEGYIARSRKLPLDTPRDRFTIVASRSHLSDETLEFVESMRAEHGEVEFISSGSSIKIALVAEGSADVYPRFAPTMEWDTAAGDAVARCAGAEVVRSVDSQPLEYNKEDLLNPWFIVRQKK